MRVRSLSQEEPLEEGMPTHSSIPAWGIPWIEKPGGRPWGRKESDTTERLSIHTRKIFGIDLKCVYISLIWERDDNVSASCG